MRAESSVLGSVGIMAGLIAASAAHAAAPTGIEFQINARTVGAQRAPAVAMDADGDFVVVWHGDDDNAFGVLAQRFASSGSPLAGEFQVNTYTDSHQRYPRVAMTPAGAFVVVWESLGQDGSAHGVFGARFDSAGTAVGEEFQVNVSASNDQRYPAVATRADGSFVVVWHSQNQDGNAQGTFAARFDAGGMRLASEFQANVYTTNNQNFADVAVDPEGRFVVVWQSINQDGDNAGTFARRFDSSGGGLGGEFQVNQYTTQAQSSGRVAVDADGDFTIAWQSAQDGGVNGIFARRWSDDGVALGPEFQVNTYTFALQNRPVVAFDGAGGFVIAWIDLIQDGSLSGVFARRFDSTGTAETPEFQVNTYTAFYQQNPALAMSDEGNFVVVWQSAPQDGDTEGVFGQLFRRLSVYDIDGNGATDALTDGLLILRYFFGFRGATLVTSAVGPGCTRCDAPSIEAFIADNL
jgi:hypothetical protein